MRKLAINHKDFLLLTGIILPQIVVIMYFGVHKTWLFGDEQWTFNLANHYYEPFLGDASRYYNQWLTSDFWNKALTVQPKYAFNYNSVFYNQAQDVHPPLYYVIIHTICSFLPNVFSKWFGLIPNIIFFVITQVALYRTGLLLFKKAGIALVTCFLYGFSWGIVNNTVYIRMYVLWALWGMLSYYFHLRLLKAFSNKLLVLSLLVSLCGILTQYYFLIFQFFLSGGYAIYQLFQKRYKRFFIYCIGYICVLCAAIAIFPASIYQITGKVGNQGQAAFNNLASSSFGNRLSTFVHITSMDIFGGHIRWVMETLVVVFVISVLLKFCHIGIALKRNPQMDIHVDIHFYRSRFEFNIVFDYVKISILYTLFVATAYFTVVAKIAPYLESRYLVIVYPMVVILFIALLQFLGRLDHWSQKCIYLMIILLTVFSSGNTYRMRNLFGYDPKYSSMMEIINQDYHSDIAFIIISKGKTFWPVINEVTTMANADYSLLLSEEDLDNLKSYLDSYSKNHNAFLVYYGNMNEQDSKNMEKIISENTEYKNFKIVDFYMGNIYLFTKM